MKQSMYTTWAGVFLAQLLKITYLVATVYFSVMSWVVGGGGIARIPEHPHPPTPTSIPLSAYQCPVVQLLAARNSWKSSMWCLRWRCIEFSLGCNLYCPETYLFWVLQPWHFFLARSSALENNLFSFQQWRYAAIPVPQVLQATSVHQTLMSPTVTRYLKSCKGWNLMRV